jgi:hypothetical protein
MLLLFPVLRDIEIVHLVYICQTVKDYYRFLKPNLNEDICYTVCCIFPVA